MQNTQMTPEEIKAFRLLKEEIVWQQFNWGKGKEKREPITTMIDYMQNHVDAAREMLGAGNVDGALTRIRILAGVTFNVLAREDVKGRGK